MPTKKAPFRLLTLTPARATLDRVVSAATIRHHVDNLQILALREPRFVRAILHATETYARQTAAATPARRGRSHR